MTASPSTEADAGFSPIEKLTKSHDLSGFSCGDDALDEWLRKYALAAQAGEGAKTYIVMSGTRVAGYYAVMAGSISVATATTRVAKGQPKTGTVPIALLARLAVNRDFQGQGLGSALLKDALLRCAKAADEIGVRAILVHALNDNAKAFYQHFGFEASPADGMTLMLMMKDLRSLIS